MVAFGPVSELLDAFKEGLSLEDRQDAVGSEEITLGVDVDDEAVVDGQLVDEDGGMTRFSRSSAGHIGHRTLSRPSGRRMLVAIGYHIP